MSKEKSALYLRKSRLDVEMEKQGEMETLARHKKILMELAEQRGIDITDIYTEVVSGESIADRPQMQRLLSDIKKHKYKNVVVMEIERLARGATKDQGEVAEAFKMSNTFVVTPAKTYDPNNEFDEEYFEFSLYMSRREYKTIQRRMTIGKIQAVKEGNYMGSRRPYGYDILKRGKNDRTLTPNEKEAPVVKMIFDWWTKDRLTAGEIARKLTKMGIKTHVGKVEWNRGQINKMLRNKLYIGIIHWYKRPQKKEMDGEKIVKRRRLNLDDETIMEVQGKHPAIIDVKVYEEAQKLFTHVAPVHNTKLIKNPFAGLLRCPKCGLVMTYNPYKHALTRIQHRASYTCKVRSCHYHEVVEALVEALQQKLNDFEIQLAECNTEKEILTYKHLKKLYESDIEKLEKKKRNLFDVFEEGIYTKNEFIERKVLLNDQLQVAYENLENLHPPDEHELQNKIFTFHNVIKSIQDETIPGHQRNQLLKDIISKIYYTYNNGVELDVYFKQ